MPLCSLPTPHPPLLPLTELVKVRIALGTGHRAHQPRLQERCPLVDQAALATHVVLQGPVGGDEGEALTGKGAVAEPLNVAQEGLTLQIWPTRDTDRRPSAGVASTADFVFAKASLADYCETNNIPYARFDTFAELPALLAKLPQGIAANANAFSTSSDNQELFHHV